MTFPRAAAWLALVLACAAARAQESPQALYRRSLAASCAACHGTDGEPARGSTAARLAGMPRKEFLKKMHDARTGKSKTTVMAQLVRGYSDAQIEQLASYFAAQKK
jgi:cytochrome c553